MGSHFQFISKILHRHFAILALGALRGRNDSEFGSEAGNDPLNDALRTRQLRQVTDQFCLGIGRIDVLASWA